MSSDDGAKPGPSSAITQEQKVTVPDEEIGSMRHMAVDPGHCINYNLAPEEFVVQCPYEKSHFIRPSRAESHLYRCRNNYAKARAMKGLPEQPRVTCRYCPFHRVRAMEVEFHEAQCYYKHVPFDEILKGAERVDPDREKKEKEKGIDPNAWKYDPEYLEWCPTPGIIPYNPLESEAYTQSVYHPIPTRMSKGDKKKWWAAERERVNRVLAGPPFQDSYQQPFLETPRSNTASGTARDSDDEGNLILIKFDGDEATRLLRAATIFEGPEPIRTLFYNGSEDQVQAEGFSQQSTSKSKNETETASKEIPPEGAQPVVTLQPIASGSQPNSSLVPIEGMATVEATQGSGGNPATEADNLDEVVGNMEKSVEGLKLDTESKTSSKLARAPLWTLNGRSKKKPVAIRDLKLRARPFIKGTPDSTGPMKKPRITTSEPLMLPAVGSSPFSLNRLKEPPKPE